MPEVHHESALLLRNKNLRLIAPDFIVAELVSVATRKVRRGELTQEGANTLLSRFPDMGVELRPSSALVQQTLDLAVNHHPSAHDCLYAALAIREQCPVVTADRKFYDALAPAFPANLVWIADLPGYLADG